MAINFVTGLPRQGKTLWTICWVKDRAEREKRPVYYCNIPEVTIDGWTEIDHPDKWMTDVPNDALVIVDELQDFWGMAPAGSKVPAPILELSKHGKRGIDFYFITQDPSLVHATPRKLCEWHYHVIRAFGTKSATLHKFQRMQTDPERVKKKAEKIIFPYPSKVFGKKDKAGNWISKPWYKSADVHNVQRQIPWKLVALPIMVIVAGAAIWGTWQMLGKSVDTAKAAAGGDAVSSILPGAGSANVATPPSARNQGPVRMTREEWIAQHRPRLADFPNTAPKYDEVTKPVIAPYPAACIAAKDRCDCYTQQGTKLPSTSNDVCQQIVANGYFVDWSLPQAREAAPVQVRAQDKPQRLVSAPAPGAGAVQTEDAQFLEWKKKQDTDQAMTALAIRNAGPRLQGTLSNLQR